MEIKNTINNIKVTVEYDTQEDLELTMALKKLSETKTNYETTDSFYTPKINAIGKAKWDAICEQLKPLVEAMKEAKIAVIRAFYIDDKTGEEIRISINGSNRMYAFCSWFNENHDLSTPLSVTSRFGTFGMSPAGFITRWEEYNIYNNLRFNLFKEIEKETKRIQKDTNAIIDHFADVRDHN
nr:MAG TPA: hypothetical protein [Siphoviridae sp. ctngg6]